MVFNNAGTVDVLAGELDLTDGGSQTGSFDIAVGTTLLLNGDQSFSSTSTLSGGGTLSIPGGTTTAAPWISTPRQPSAR
jgi:hypothetical protein